VAGALINVPAEARRGEIIEIKALVSHPMETGYRRTQYGTVIPRDIIRQFVCTWRATDFTRDRGEPVDQFAAVATGGKLEFRWTGTMDFRRPNRRQFP
jgi:sulfur-oxidizing protein SoxZ